MVVFIIFCLILAGIVAYEINQERLYKEFYSTFPSELFFGVVAINRTETNGCRAELTVPKWRYTNRDGSPDRRRNNNCIIEGEQVLYLQHDNAKYMVHFRYFRSAVKTMNNLRCHGVNIPLIPQELNKQAQLLEDRKIEKSIMMSKEARDIYTAYETDPYGFEEFTARWFATKGYRAEVTPKSGDAGIDVNAVKNGVHYRVQCKCYSPDRKVGRPDIQKLVGACAGTGAKPVFVTTADYSLPAIRYAKEHGVVLYAGSDLISKSEYEPRPIKDEECWLTNDDVTKILKNKFI